MRFTGRQPKELIPDFLAASHVALIHLKREPLFRTVLPSKIFEAAGMCRPIVLGVEGHAAALVERGEMGICIEPENAEELVAALDRLRESPDLRRQLGESGYR